MANWSKIATAANARRLVWGALCVTLLVLRLFVWHHLVDNSTAVFGYGLAVVGAVGFFLIEVFLPMIRKGNSRFHRKASGVCLLAATLAAISGGLDQQRHAMAEDAFKEELRKVLAQELQGHLIPAIEHRTMHLENDLRDLKCTAASKNNQCSFIWSQLTGLIAERLVDPATVPALLAEIDRLHTHARDIDSMAICYCTRHLCRLIVPAAPEPTALFALGRLLFHPVAPASFHALLVIILFVGLHIVSHILEEAAHLVSDGAKKESPTPPEATPPSGETKKQSGQKSVAHHGRNGKSAEGVPRSASAVEGILPDVKAGIRACRGRTGRQTPVGVRDESSDLLPDSADEPLDAVFKESRA